jgi:hypothetical protein
MSFRRIYYKIERMRFLHFLLSLLLLSACGGRSLNSGHARNIISGMPQDSLEKEDVDIIKVSQSSSSEAVVETRLKTAFRLEKVRGKWEVREVRIGHGPWENISNLERTLELVRIDETRKMLDAVAESIQAYRKAHGAMPEFKDYISLTDLLSPAFMTPLIRLDAWRRPFGAERLNKSISLWSAGPDGKPGTADDIRKIVD